MSSLPFYHLNNDEFHLALLEMSHGNFSFDTDRFSTFHFNPLEFKKSSHCLDADPDELLPEHFQLQ